MGASAGSCLLLQFAREPVVGKVKTRMMPSLSARHACDLHCRLVLWTTDTLVGAGLGPVELLVAGASEHALFEDCLHRGVARVGHQRGSDLGARMATALAEGLRRYERVILVGSDCPGIDSEYLAGAVRALDSSDVVLGPASDGGYVLVGAKRVYEAMFEGIVWGSDAVMASTRERLEAAAVNWAQLSPLTDIDRPEDLASWEALQQRGRAPDAWLRR